MTAQVVTAKELIGYLADIAAEHGDIPIVVHSTTSGEIESVGQPVVLPVTPAGEADGFQVYAYPPQEDAPKSKAAILY